MNPAEEEAAVGLEVADSRVGWVYRLNKEGLMEELRFRKLRETGTVDELRRRLVKQLRTEAAIIRNPTPEPILREPEANPSINNFETLNQLRKLNIVFDGKADPVLFLERIEQVREEYEISENQLLKTLPGLLQNKAYQWYMNYRHAWTSYYDFIEEFKIFFYPPDYRDNLEELISQRYQAPHESARDFILDLQTMIRRHGGYSTDRELTCIYRRLRPEYRQYVRRGQVKTIREVLLQAYEYEQLQTDLNKRSKTSTTVQPIAAASTRDRVITPTNNKRPAPRFQTEIICFRCGNKGHVRAHCTGTPRLFCSKCGRDGVQTRHCNCETQAPPKAGNAGGAGENGPTQPPQ